MSKESILDRFMLFTDEYPVLGIALATIGTIYIAAFCVGVVVMLSGVF